MKVIASALLFAGVTLFVYPATANDPAIVSVCELLANREVWDGKYIRVTGLVRNDFLIDAECPVPAVNGVKFSRSIAIERPGAPGVRAPDSWLDKPSARLLEITQEFGLTFGRDVRATITGMFATREAKDLIRHGAEFGFGNQGVAIGMIVMQSAANITLMPKASPDR